MLSLTVLGVTPNGVRVKPDRGPNAPAWREVSAISRMFFVEHLVDWRGMHEQAQEPPRLDTSIADDAQATDDPQSAAGFADGGPVPAVSTDWADGPPAPSAS